MRRQCHSARRACRIPDEMGRVTCDWCDVLMRGSWEESSPLPLLLPPPAASPGILPYPRFPPHVAECGFSGSRARLFHFDQRVTSFGCGERRDVPLGAAADSLPACPLTHDRQYLPKWLCGTPLNVHSRSQRERLNRRLI